MRSDIIETFQATLVQCFSQTIENLFGRPVKEQLIRILAEHKIPRSEIGALIVDPMKQVHEPPPPTRNESKQGKVDQASLRFVDLFRRIAAENQQEKLTNG